MSRFSDLPSDVVRWQNRVSELLKTHPVAAGNQMPVQVRVFHAVPFGRPIICHRAASLGSQSYIMQFLLRSVMRSSLGNQSYLMHELDFQQPQG